MKLAPLLAVLGHSCDQDVDISSLSCDSRTITPGALFVAIPGEHADGTPRAPKNDAAGSGLYGKIEVKKPEAAE